MNKNVFLSAVSFAIFSICGVSGITQSFAQQEAETIYESEFIGSICRVQTQALQARKGAIYIGEVVKDDGIEFGIIDEFLGLVILSKDQIASIEKINLNPADASNSGEPFVPKGAFTTRNIFTANAFNIEKGKHYAMFNLYGPEVHIAVNDRLNVGAIATWIGSPLGIETKYTLTNEDSKVKFAIGGIGGNGGYLTQFKYNTGLVWGTLTMGSRQNNISLSAGYGLFESQEMWADSGSYAMPDYNYDNLTEAEWIATQHDISTGTVTYSSLVFSVAGALRVGRKTSLIFDSMFFPKVKANRQSNFDSDWMPDDTYIVHVTDVEETGNRSLAVIMPGCRIQSTSTKAFQFSVAGIMATDNDGDFTPIPIPMCSWFRGF